MVLDKRVRVPKDARDARICPDGRLRAGNATPLEITTDSW
jgi:hypothetical protein